MYTKSKLFGKVIDDNDDCIPQTLLESSDCNSCGFGLSGCALKELCCSVGKGLDLLEKMDAFRLGFWQRAVRYIVRFFRSRRNIRTPAKYGMTGVEIIAVMKPHEFRHFHQILHADPEPRVSGEFPYRSIPSHLQNIWSPRRSQHSKHGSTYVTVFQNLFDAYPKK